MKEVGNFHSMRLLANSLFVNLALLVFVLQFPNLFEFTLLASYLAQGND
jgi:hypothetical protein